jgi:hypothetical protein
MSGDFRLPPIRRPGKDPAPEAPRQAGSPDQESQRPRSQYDGGERVAENRGQPDRRSSAGDRYGPADDRSADDRPTDRRPGGSDRRPPSDRSTGRSEPDPGRRPASERDRSGPDSGRRPTDGERSHRPEAGRRPHQETEGGTVERAEANPRTFGPWIKVTGRVMREPQSLERTKPSFTPALAAQVLLALCLMLPYVLMNIGYIVVGLVLLIIIARKLHLGWGLGSIGSRGHRQEKPRILVTNFRAGVPKPEDPRAIGRELSCRLLTRQIDGAVELSGGDEVTITGWRGGGQIVHVGTLVVTATKSRTKAAPGASAAPVAITSAVLLALSATALWFNRAWLSPQVLTQAVNVLEQSVVQLVTLVVVLLIMWFVLKKVIFRR